MTLRDLTLVMTDDVRITVLYKGDRIFTGTVDEFYNDYIQYQGEEIDSTVFLEKVVVDVFYSIVYNAIWIEIEF